MLVESKERERDEEGIGKGLERDGKWTRKGQEMDEKGAGNG
jgi:hypothetical protein